MSKTNPYKVRHRVHTLEPDEQKAIDQMALNLTEEFETDFLLLAQNRKELFRIFLPGYEDEKELAIKLFRKKVLIELKKYV